MNTETPEPMPADWWPPAAALATARDRCPDVDVDAETRKFVDRMSTSRKRRKSWLSTWQGVVYQVQDARAPWYVRHERDRAAAVADVVEDQGDTAEVVDLGAWRSRKAGHRSQVAR